MEWVKHLARSKRSLMLHRLRTLLSTLGILFGVVAVVTMLSIGEGAKQETLEQIEQLGLNTLIVRQSTLSSEQRLQAIEKRSQGLTAQDVEAIKKGTPQLLAASAVKVIAASLPGALQDVAPETLAVSRSYGQIKDLKVAEGRFLTDLDEARRNLVCVIGADIAKALGVAGHVGKTLRLEGLVFKIVGVLQSSQWKSSKNALLASKNVNQMIFIPLGSEAGLYTAAHLNTRHVLSEIVIQLKPGENLTRAAAVVKHILKRRHGGYEDYQIIIPQELLNQAQQTQRTFNLVLGSIAAISLLVGGIGIMNMMLANVTERIREIGIRRALGAKRQDIMVQFLTETLLLTFFGALAGIVFGVFFSLMVSYLAGWKTIVTLWSLILSLGMAGGVGLCSGLYPAYQAACLHPIVALRR